MARSRQQTIHYDPENSTPIDKRLRKDVMWKGNGSNRVIIWADSDRYIDWHPLGNRLAEDPYVIAEPSLLSLVGRKGGKMKLSELVSLLERSHFMVEGYMTGKALEMWRDVVAVTLGHMKKSHPMRVFAEGWKGKEISHAYWKAFYHRAVPFVSYAEHKVSNMFDRGVYGAYVSLIESESRCGVQMENIVDEVMQVYWAWKCDNDPKLPSYDTILREGWLGNPDDAIPFLPPELAKNFFGTAR